MMKLKTFLLFLLTAMCAKAQYSTLNVWLKNGDIVRFAFSEELKIVATSASELTIEAGTYSISYPVSNLRKFTVGNDTVPPQLTLSEGWNWISHALQADIPVSTLTGATQILSQEASAYRDKVLGLVGELKSLTAGKGYKVNMTTAGVFSFPGTTSQTDIPISLHQGWNWVGCPLPFPTPLSTALAGGTWAEGDCLASQDAFAVYSDGAWAGSLQTLTPSAAYLVKSATAKSLRYSPAGTEARERGQIRIQQQRTDRPFRYKRQAYPNTMNIIAQLSGADNGDYTVAAFCGDECRGIGQLANGRLFLTVHGTGGEPITFQALDTAGTLHAIEESTDFEADLIGSVPSPYTLTLAIDATGIPHRPAESAILPAEPLCIYTLSGLLVKTVQPSYDGDIDLLLSDLPGGTYIFKSKSLNFKMTKRR